MSFYLVLVGPLDNPLSEHTFSSSRPSSLPAGGLSSGASSSSHASSSLPSWASSPPPPSATSSSFGNNFASMAGVRDLSAEARKRGGGYDVGHLRQMVAHSSLDLVEDAMNSGAMYLKAIDKFNEWTVSAFVAPQVKFILLHETKNDEGIRQFFLDVWESYVKVSLNPFHTPNTPIKSPLFDGKVRASARKHL